jgi:hypothetical protein
VEKQTLAISFHWNTGCVFLLIDHRRPGEQRDRWRGSSAGEVMRHVFASKPRFCVGFKPGLIRVRCAKCGEPHFEYLGPKDRDEVRAELELLRRELARAFAILALRRNPAPPSRKQAAGRRRSISRRRK